MLLTVAKDHKVMVGFLGVQQLAQDEAVNPDPKPQTLTPKP